MIYKATVQERRGQADTFVSMCQGSGLVHSESMDITNDPRFFTDNVLDKRLAAFGGLAVVTSIGVGSTLGQCYNMSKNIDLSTIDGVLQFTSFILMNSVLFTNVLATYVSVAQMYFTYRLMTAGPTGFESASAFYLSPCVAFWRHYAVKSMLTSLPLFLVASAFRIIVKFDREMPDISTHSKKLTMLPWWEARFHDVSVLGIITWASWVFMSAVVLSVHLKHRSVFQARYREAQDAERPLLTSVRGLTERMTRATPDF